jgi:hypothetical protein
MTTTEEEAFDAWWDHWKAAVFQPWADARPTSPLARSIQRQYRATLTKPDTNTSNGSSSFC